MLNCENSWIYLIRLTEFRNTKFRLKKTVRNAEVYTGINGINLFYMLVTLQPTVEMENKWCYNSSKFFVAIIYFCLGINDYRLLISIVYSKVRSTSAPQISVLYFVIFRCIEWKLERYEDSITLNLYKIYLRLSGKISYQLCRIDNNLSIYTVWSNQKGTVENWHFSRGYLLLN